MIRDYSNQLCKTITIKDTNRITQIEISHISHITCQGYLSSIHLINTDETKFSSKLLKTFEKILEPEGFIRINHNTLVNLKSIKAFDTGNCCMVTLINNVQIKISRRKLKPLKEKLLLIAKNIDQAMAQEHELLP